mgnify:CR=1 FL=1
MGAARPCWHQPGLQIAAAWVLLVELSALLRALRSIRLRCRSATGAAPPGRPPPPQAVPAGPGYVKHTIMGKVFDPAKPEPYLAGFAIKRA